MKPIVIALPKGRIQEEVVPILEKVGIRPQKAFFDDRERQLQFECEGGFSIIRVRSFDVATFVAFGAAQLGICGSDVLMEFDYPDLYAPLDLGIGKCRLSVAEPQDAKALDLARLSHIRVATKYPNTTRRYFAGLGIQAECVKLSGAMELAPSLGLAQHIVDLVSSGKTLEANGLKETSVIADISSRLIVNRAAFKTRSHELSAVVDRFREVAGG
ncbi:MAG: ATP phosphoribosyltransferase [Alphaproteobacteria bacterium]|nr:ATP phosphoribosyltransferase [Alphaproteobacteria bacterium]